VHEMRLVGNIVALLEKEVAGPEVGNVKTVYLRVGALREVVPEIMNACFRQTPKNAKLDGAAIDIEVIPVVVRCSGCGEERSVDNGVYRCPGCAGAGTEMISGNEFILKGIEW
jgi:hydrogenase nickel incorporation protein HypA/HybF